MAVKTASVKALKGYKGIAMEGLIATWYARNTRSRIAEQRALAQRIAGIVPRGGSVLEVAPGPGYLSIELAKLGGCRCFGLDISETFVKIERQNARETGVEVDFRHGDATTMPFEDTAFDFAVCVAAFKNFTQPLRVLEELYRVLKRGGAALIVDLRKDASMEDINAEVNRMKLNAVNAFLTRGAFKGMLLKSAYTQAQMEALVAQTSFKACDIKCDYIGMEIALTK